MQTWNYWAAVQIFHSFRLDGLGFAELPFSSGLQRECNWGICMSGMHYIPLCVHVSCGFAFFWDYRTKSSSPNLDSSRSWTALAAVELELLLNWSHGVTALLE